MSCASIVQYMGHMRLHTCGYAMYWMVPDDKSYTFVLPKAASKLKPRTAAYWSASGVNSLPKSVNTFLHLHALLCPLVLKCTTKALNVLNKANSCHETA